MDLNLDRLCVIHNIFQVTVECTERGELLANLRKRYADLLGRIPRQVKRCVTDFHYLSPVRYWETANNTLFFYCSLHQEVIAQRALDR